MGQTWDNGFWGVGTWDPSDVSPLTRKKMKSKLGLYKLNHDELADTGDSVHTGMVANAATFTNPSPTMPTLATDLTALRTRIAARKTAEAALAIAVQAEGAAAEVVRADLSKEQTYVDFIAAGDPAIILKANMQVRRSTSPVGPMPKILDVKTSPSDYAGAVDVMWPPVTGASAFVLQACTGDPNVAANWHYAGVATKSSATLTGLAAGNVWVRVAAKGADDQPGPWSDAAQEVVR
jgi:hypothetical protein